MLLIILLLILGSIVAFAYALTLKHEQKEFIVHRIPVETSQSKNILLGILTPFVRPLLKGALRENIRRKVLNAKVNLTVEEYFSFKIILMIVCGAGAYLALKEPIFVFFGVVFGYLAPDIWLNQKIRAHKEAIQRLLPETIDLLSLCVGAGLDFAGAVKWVTEKSKPNSLLEEFKFVLNEIRVGKPRLAALKDMSVRLQIPDVTSFVNNLVMADRMGTPVEEAFSVLSDDIRMRRAQRGERQALKAPIKILIPLIFCILPIILIVIAGPIMINFTQGQMFKGLTK